MKAKDIMTHDVVSVEPDADILRAIRLMLQNRISGLPVVDGAGRLAGILTEGDLLRRAETGTQRKRPRWLEFIMGPGRLADEYVRTHGFRVDEVMTPDPAVVTEDTPVDEIVDLMERRQIKRVPVMRGDRMVGIVSRANLMHALAGLALNAAPSTPEDAGIRQQLLSHLRNQSWAPVRAVNVVVSDGVVGLWGTITDERERQAMIVAAENTPGVRRVVDHLAWVDPSSGLVFYGADDERFRATAL